jgi:hypothetical protein
LSEFDEWLGSWNASRCKWKHDHCSRGNEVEGYEDEGLICFSKTGCPFEVVHDEDGLTSFPQTLKKSPYWSLWGFANAGKKEVVDCMVLDVIRTWAGDSLEPSQMKHRTKDEQYEIMYNALDLIYKLIDHVEDKPLNVATRHDGKWMHYHIDKIQSAFCTKEQEP